MLRFIRFLSLLWLPFASLLAEEKNSPVQHWAEIQVIDAATQRGIPLVELETVNGLKFLTDNAGRIAIQEPGWLQREVFFHVRSHGYILPRDGFGYTGAKVKLSPERAAIIAMHRTNIAERMCRLTGEGMYRDSELLGYASPLKLFAQSGNVAGQDTVQAAVYQNKVYWLWGDTSRMEYPLGMFRTAGATSPYAELLKSDFTHGIGYHYFIDPKTQFTRPMMPLPERSEGVIWMSTLCVVPDAAGTEQLIAYYSRRKGLEGEYEQGIALYNAVQNIFEPIAQLPLTETWRKPSGHAIPYVEAGTHWLLFGSPNVNVRVRATLADVLNPEKYEAFTCAQKIGNTLEPVFNAQQEPEWRWQAELPPVDSKQEQVWVKAGKLLAEKTRFYPANIENAQERIVLHSGTVRWNTLRNCWVLIAGQLNGTASHLGEVWYAEAKHASGPFTQAIKIVTHEKQTFYNVCHHAFLDTEDGRYLHFEGTYTNDFSVNSDKTARYNYNQMLYRLDVQHPTLKILQTAFGQSRNK